MKKILISLFFIGAFMGSSTAWAQVPATDPAGNDQAMVDNNEVINDEGYGNDEEYYAAEEEPGEDMPMNEYTDEGVQANIEVNGVNATEAPSAQ